MPVPTLAHVTPLNWTCRPADVLSAWPPDRGLGVVWAGGETGGRGRRGSSSRWTIIAEPTRTEAGGWELVERAGAAEPSGPDRADADQPGFAARGMWIASLGYSLGRRLEASARHGAGPADDRAWPEVVAARCDAGLAYDTHKGRWWAFGEPRAWGSEPRAVAGPRGFHLGPMRSGSGQARYERSVARALEYIRAGDIYQVNLAHRLSGEFEGSCRGLFGELIRRSCPWHGAYLEAPDAADGTRRVICSASPELFLEVGAGGGVVARPMKGTRPGNADPEELRASVKDRAELDMIIDLMRNDIGRVCRPGSVRVEQRREIERHGGPEAAKQPAAAGELHSKAAGEDGHAGVWQATATVTGQLNDGATIAELLRATFPGGSVTGAPKIRAMQIIEELEPVARGPYCGAIGWIGAEGRAAFNIAIRTACISGLASPTARDAIVHAGVLDWSVGAGIVADSNPHAEWRETMDKAGVILSLAGAGEAVVP